MISSDQISVIIQGAIGAELNDCIRSVRKGLPKSEIILSTWEGSQLPDGLVVDACIFSPDPGARPAVKDGKLLNNTNRQLVSTLAGLLRASRPYALKLRTDFEIHHPGFIQGFTTSDVRDPDYTLYKHKIVIPHYATRYPSPNSPSYPFHPSDLSLFGLRDDIIKHFDAPPLDEADWNWALQHESEIIWDQNLPLFLPRFAPEQHFFVHSLRAHGRTIDMRHYHDTRGDIAEQSRRYLVNNFVVLDMQDYGIRTRKSALAHAITKDINNCYSHNLYRAEYRKWCDPNARLTWQESLEARLTRRKRIHEKLVKHRIAMQQHAQLIFRPSDEGSFTHSHKMLADAISCFYYFVRAIV
ncbi:MAG: WavE lipopolysaccharide synthesis family protein [Pseudomonadota bacterium]